MGLYLQYFVYCIFFYSIYIDNSKILSIDALFLLDNTTKITIPIFRYEFSEQFEETLTAAFLENEALKKYWNDGFIEIKNKEEQLASEKNPVLKESIKSDVSEVGYFSIIKVLKDEIKERSKQDKIIIEALEFVLLEQLSLHLSSYFNNYNDHDKLVKEYTRMDFPEMLLQNRIINLLSTPFEERAIFVKAGMTNHPPEGEIVHIYGDDGSRYSKFNLVLPSNSKVRRPKEGILVIENDRVFVEMKIIYDNFSSNLPVHFANNYIGISPKQIHSKKVNIILSYKVKPRASFYNSRWGYHNWVDSFAERLVKFASFEAFIDRIEWEATLTNLIVTKNSRQMKSPKQ